MPKIKHENESTELFRTAERKKSQAKKRQQDRVQSSENRGFLIRVGLALLSFTSQMTSTAANIQNGLRNIAGTTKTPLLNSPNNFRDNRNRRSSIVDGQVMETDNDKSSLVYTITNAVGFHFRKKSVGNGNIDVTSFTEQNRLNGDVFIEIDSVYTPAALNFIKNKRAAQNGYSITGEIEEMISEDLPGEVTSSPHGVIHVSRSASENSPANRRRMA